MALQGKPLCLLLLLNKNSLPKMLIENFTLNGFHWNVALSY